MKKLESIRTINDNMLRQIRNLIGMSFNGIENGNIHIDGNFIKLMDILYKAEYKGLQIKDTICFIEAVHESGEISERDYIRDVDKIANEAKRFAEELFEEWGRLFNKVITNI